jgi:hypothetical protein
MAYVKIAKSFAHGPSGPLIAFGDVVAPSAPLMLTSSQLRLVEMACVLSVVAAYRLE